MTAPKSAFDWVPDSGPLWGLRRTIAEPVLYGQGDDATYDRPLHRWIPAHSSAVSPNGGQYAYASKGPGDSKDSASVHIVNVLSGQDRVAATGDNFWPLMFNSDGVYLTQRSGANLWGGGGIFLLDPITNKVRQLHGAGKVEIWQIIGGRFAYGARFNPADPMPAGMGEAPNELIRLDMTTGVIDALVYRPGQAVAFAGKTSDGRIMASFPGGLHFVDWQGQTTLIRDAPGDASIFTDDEQTWFLSGSTPRHVYNLSGNRAKHVMDFDAYTNPNRYMSLAGGCY
jgi:hypothetical protein